MIGCNVGWIDGVCFAFEEDAKKEYANGEHRAKDVEAQTEPALGNVEAVEGSGVHVAVFLELVAQDLLFGGAADGADTLDGAVGVDQDGTSCCIDRQG